MCTHDDSFKVKLKQGGKSIIPFYLFIFKRGGESIAVLVSKKKKYIFLVSNKKKINSSPSVDLPFSFVNLKRPRDDSTIIRHDRLYQKRRERRIESSLWIHYQS